MTQIVKGEAGVKTTFSELVIEGPFALVKGFLMGFLCTYPELPRYSLHRKVGIRRHTLRDLLSELFEFDNLVHLCLEDRVVEEFKGAIAKATPTIGISIKALKKIASTEFNFSFEIFDKALAHRCKAMFSDLPHDVSLVNFECKDKAVEDESTSSAYAPMHAYSL